MSNKLIIEKLSGKNFDSFVDLIVKLANYEKLKAPNKETKKRLKKDGLSKNPKFEAFLGKVDSEYVSYMIYFMAYSSFQALPTLFLEDFFVIEEYRKKGIGQKMFDFCIKQAKARKCGRIDLCIFDWNRPSINFFEKNNAERLNYLFYRISLVA